MSDRPAAAQLRTGHPPDAQAPGPGPPDRAGVRAELAAAVTDLVVDPDRLAAAGTDRSGLPASAPPLAVVAARTVDDVTAALRIAHTHRIPVIPRGAGTGLAGGAVTGEGSIVVDLTTLDRIVEIDPVDELARVEPGVLTAELDRAARTHGLRYIPDPASAAISTIGGNIATNAGGMRCVKYGVTGDWILGLEVALADGTIISTGRRTVKGVAGLDLTSLFVGSEGTLGIVVGATVRLAPIPDDVVTVSAGFASVHDAASACAAVIAGRGDPSLLELVDAATLRVIDRAQGTDLATRAGALVIAQADGRSARTDAAVIANILGAHAQWTRTATDQTTADELLAARRLALPSIEAFGRALIEDICVPRSRLAQAFDAVADIGRRHGVDLYTFAHAGDGNLHPILAYDTALTEPPAAVQRAADEIFGVALELGGTISGEHGVGILKRDWLAREAGPASLSVQQAIKSALDPRGILNPDKVLKVHRPHAMIHT
ncbi:FAD-linked oxidase C-terminal domain-containing protein [Gordonia sp. ABSL1-1]|uniref:FAD-binding oxidoreductase n=1 Tax=Gordonia sp. ABSL1-1 TaxID=3053923 RepID=UPI0025739747|nr:FAD-linked oxidase C-terminal domain-containing protein [Gordonia sp. ABSL1-1]MDL9937283.1 FAD-linked oxidase C-terminal domain-containing protein [Gordonia sp. ABSL1-1]